MKLHDMLKFSEENGKLIRPLVPDYPINLIEISRFPEEIRRKLTSDFGLITEYLTRRKDPKHLEEFMRDRVHTIRHPEEFLDMLSEVTGDKQYKKVKEMLQEEERESVTMCVISDKLVNQGREEGKLLMIKNLIAEGLLKIEDALRVLEKTAEELEKEFTEVQMKEIALEMIGQ